MEAMCCSVSFDQIDWEDATYAIRSFQPSAALEVSLERFGILVVPWVLRKRAEKFVLVDGFKRLQWARRKGWKDIQCLIFSNETEEEVWLQRLEGKLFGPPLNVAEKAQIIAKLADFLSPETMVREIFPRLGVASRADSLDDWRCLAAAGEDVLQAVASEDIFERTALELMTWEEEVRRKMLGLLKELKCSASIQWEILERMTEIGLLLDRMRLDLFYDPGFQAIITDSSLNHRRKTGLLRDWLTQLRFPRLQAREKHFITQLEKLSLPGSVRLLHPPAFEGERWQLQLGFTCPDDLLAVLDKARDLARSPALESLMSPPQSRHDRFFGKLNGHSRTQKNSD